MLALGNKRKFLKLLNTPETVSDFIRWLADISIDDIPLVGGKNAWL